MCLLLARGRETGYRVKGVTQEIKGNGSFTEGGAGNSWSTPFGEDLTTSIQRAYFGGVPVVVQGKEI